MVAVESPGMTEVVCHNSRCRYDGQPRTVGRQHLGQGVYVGGALVCECGQALTESSPDTSPVEVPRG